MKKFLLTVLIMATCHQLTAQEHGAVCGTDYMDSVMRAENPALQQEQIELEEEILRLRDQKDKKATSRIIPVVFHVIHQYGEENISKALIEGAIDQLNLDYQMLNPDVSQARSVFSNVVGDMDVEFRLARKDPDGNCTEGIVRIPSVQTNQGDDEDIKDLSRWDVTKYMNVWVVKSIQSIDGFTTAGYAFLPPADPKKDGIVVAANFVGKGGRTLTHEVGHYLGLLHPFESGCLFIGANCNITGDRVCDTPPSKDANFDCPTSLNSCNTDNPDLVDQIENFMDYSSCRVMFTKGQKQRIDAVFTAIRSKLISSANLKATGTENANPGITCPPIAEFNASRYRICRGNSLEFADMSYNGPVTSRTWRFPGSAIIVSSLPNPEVTYQFEGVFPVTLIVSNSAGTDSITKTAYVEVIPDEAPTDAPYAQGFEDANFTNEGWVFENRHPEIGWERNGSVGATGSSSIWLNNNEIESDIISSFFLPPIDMRFGSNAEFKFKVAYAQRNSNTNDALRVFVSKNCGQTWTIKSVSLGSQLSGGKTTIGNYVPQASDWIELSASLSSVNNIRNLFIRFDFVSDGGNNVYVDDIRITGTFTGVQGQHAGDFRLYPNPFTDQLVVELGESVYAIDEVVVTDILGKRLAKRSIGIAEQLSRPHVLKLTREELNITEPGIYFIKLVSGTETYTRKIIFSNP